MSKRDYYEILEITRSATDVEIKSSYRKLGDELPPGSQSGEPGRRREIQGSRGSLRDPRRTPRSGASTIASATRASARAGAGGFDPSVFTGFEDILGGLGDIFGFGDLFGGGRRRGGPQRGADLRYDLDDHLRGIGAGAETTIQIPRQETCETCHGSGRGARVDADAVPAVPRSGPGSVPAGLLHRRPHLSQSAARERSSPIRARPVRARAASPRNARSRSRFRRGSATGQQLRLQWRRRSEQPLAVLRTVTSTSSFSVHEHEFFRRDGNNLFCEVPVNFTTRRARRRRSRCRRLIGSDKIKIPRRHTDRMTLVAAQQGDAGRERTRGAAICSRPHRSRRRRSSRGNSAGCSNSSRKRCRRTSSSRQPRPKSRTNAISSIASGDMRSGKLKHPSGRRRSVCCQRSAVLALVDDFDRLAVEERGDLLRIFFPRFPPATRR